MWAEVKYFMRNCYVRGYAETIVLNVSEKLRQGRENGLQTQLSLLNLSRNYNFIAVITVSAVALNSVKDDFAFKGKHAFYRCHPSRNPLTDRD